MPPTVLALLADDRVDGTPVLAVRGELDVGTAPALTAWLTAATDHSRRAAVVDLSAVTFMAGAALHVLCDEQERLLEHGLGLTVVCQHPQLLGLFKMVELERVLDVVPTRNAARAATKAAVRPSQHLAGWVARREDDLPPEAG
jgi:anti-sigma B factor antagonist